MLDVIAEDGFLARVTEAGERLKAAAAADARVVETRGAGLLVGLTLAEPKSAEVVSAAQDAGFIVNGATPERVRMAPPLILTDADIDAFAAAWSSILDHAGVQA